MSYQKQDIELIKQKDGVFGTNKLPGKSQKAQNEFFYSQHPRDDAVDALSYAFGVTILGKSGEFIPKDASCCFKIGPASPNESEPLIYLAEK